MTGGRTLSVLVADVVGSTELFAALGVDGADVARRLVFEAFGAAIQENNGSLIKTMGDGCLASFMGAADAVGAGVAMQQAAGGLAERRVPGLRLRVGVAVGDVTEEDDDVFGPAVVTASRLCSVADASQILATDMVRMLAGDRGGHGYASVGELSLKGIAEPIAACSVRVDVAASTRRVFPHALAATPNEVVVGRSAETALLTSAIKAAAAGERRAVLVAGEPGVGKTRLVAAVARRAHDDGALVLFGRCEEDLAVAYQPFAEALRTGFADLEPETVKAHMQAHGGEIRRLVPGADGPDPVRAEPTLEQSRLFDAVTDLLARASADRPIVLVLDDLHWGAPSTIGLLRHLLNGPVSQHFCVFGTYRDTEVDRSHPLGGMLADMHRIEGVERLSLRGLDGQGIEDLMVAAGGDELDADGQALAAAVVERTAGNPFFANQMLRHLAERGVLVRGEARWRVVGDLGDVDLPEGVLDVVGRRLSRLSPAANEALVVAALCGLEFSVRVLSEVADAGEPDAVVDGLDEAVRARLLVESGPGRFAFAHAIVKDTLLRELTIAKRARLHRTIGHAIQKVYANAPDAPIAELARHFIEAAVLGDSATAAKWATAAAAVAESQADRPGAVELLERALAVIETVEPIDQAARFDVAVMIAENHWNLASLDSPALAPAIDAARKLESGRRLLRVAMAHYYRGLGLADPEALLLHDQAVALLGGSEPLRALALAWRASHRMVQGDPAFTDDVDEAMALLPRFERDAPRVAAATRCYIVLATLGLPGAAARLQLSEDALSVPVDTPDRWWDDLGSRQQIVDIVAAYRGQSLMALGRRDAVEADIEHLALTNNPISAALVQAVIGMRTAAIALAEGRFADAMDGANAMLAVVPDDENFQASYGGFVVSIAISEGRLAELLPVVQGLLAMSPELLVFQTLAGRANLAAGDTDSARIALACVLAEWEATARDMTWPTILAHVVELMVALDAPEFAPTVLAEMDLYRGETVVVGAGVFWIGAFDRFRGMVLDLLGRHDDAIGALEAGLALEESMETPAMAAETRYRLAQALIHRDSDGDRARARVELHASIAMAEQLGMGGILVEARQLENSLN